MRTRETSRQARLGWLPRAVVAGFSAAVVMLFAFLLAYAGALALTSAPLPEPLRGWFAGLTLNPLTDFANANLYVVAGGHFLVAILLALLYARYVEPVLNGPGWLRGIEFALVPWMLSVLVVLPLGGGGIFGAEMGAGPLPVLGNLLLHLLYGATLGAIYGPLGDRPVGSSTAAGPWDELEVIRRQERAMAQGIVGGLILGLVAGLVTLNVLPSPPGAVLDMPGAGVVLGWSLLGGALGAFLGSFAGLSGGPESRRRRV